MPIAEWNVPFTLQSPQGELDFNVETTVDGEPAYYVFDAPNCDAGAEIRDTKDNIPQGDGSILHRRFYTGYEIVIALQYYKVFDEIACEDDLRRMHDELMLHIRALQDGDGRLLWTPSGANQRMFDAVRALRRVKVTPQPSTLITCSFTLDTPFPYGMDAAETATGFGGTTGTQILTNTGTAPFFPVWQVWGDPTYFFTIRNNTTGLEIVYDGGLPGANPIPSGEYIEIDTFRNTVYLNGDEDNMKPGIDILESDFFPLVVGDNEIVISGEGTFPAPDVVCLWQPAWA